MKNYENSIIIFLSPICLKNHQRREFVNPMKTRRIDLLEKNVHRNETKSIFQVDATIIVSKTTHSMVSTLFSLS